MMIPYRLEFRIGQRVEVIRYQPNLAREAPWGAEVWKQGTVVGYDTEQYGSHPREYYYIVQVDGEPAPDMRDIARWLHRVPCYSTWKYLRDQVGWANYRYYSEAPIRSVGYQYH